MLKEKMRIRGGLIPGYLPSCFPASICRAVRFAFQELKIPEIFRNQIQATGKSMTGIAIMIAIINSIDIVL
jgi:hypothetical protein